jgi:hypothetical protein
MSDMQEIPPDAEEDLSSTAQTSAQPGGIEHLQHSSVPPVSETEESSEASLIQSAFKTAGIRGLLPSALAKEERTARLNESRAKRRLGTPLTADEIRDDLMKIISHLVTQLSTHNAGVSIILKMPAQALLYSERTALYAITDYPRTFENDMGIVALWDALERISILATDWRKDLNKGDGKAVIATIERLAKAAIRGVYSAPASDPTPENDDPSGDSPDT